MKNLKDKVYNYPTKSSYGFTRGEAKELLDELDIDEEKFWELWGVNTVMMDGGVTIYYPIDILRALELSLEGKTNIEWD